MISEDEEEGGLHTYCFISCGDLHSQLVEESDERVHVGLEVEGL